MVTLLYKGIKGQDGWDVEAEDLHLFILDREIIGWHAGTGYILMCKNSETGEYEKKAFHIVYLKSECFDSFKISKNDTYYIDHDEFIKWSTKLYFEE